MFPAWRSDVISVYRTLWGLGLGRLAPVKLIALKRAPP